MSWVRRSWSPAWSPASWTGARNRLNKSFSKEWYRNAYETQFTTRWLGVGVVKCPLDLHVYQEIIWQTRPELIVETGSYVGGSALYLAHVLDAVHRETLHDGQVVSVDITDHGVRLPEHPRIEFVIGKSSTDPEAHAHVAARADGKRTMVILDSDHSRSHVAKELDLYAPLVTRDCFLIVEDTNRDGYYLGGGYPDGGAAEALKQWQPTNKGFRPDHDCERLGFTQNPGGYLCRIR